VKQKLEMDFLRGHYLKLKNKVQKMKAKQDICKRCQQQID